MSPNPRPRNPQAPPSGDTVPLGTPPPRVVVEELDVILNGETWQLDKITYADQNIGDSKSGEYEIEFGDSVGGWTRVDYAILTGTTRDVILPDGENNFVGDGTKRLRITRTNHSTQPKKMVVKLDGFKRVLA